MKTIGYYLAIILLLALTLWLGAGCIHYTSEGGWGLGENPNLEAERKAKEKEVRRKDDPGEMRWGPNGWEVEK